MKKQSRYQRRNVSRITRDKYHRKPTPHVNKELIRPTLGRFEGHQMSTQQSPHHPQRGAHAEILRSLSAPRVQPERRQPLVNGHRDRSYVQAREDRDPELGGEGQEEGHERDLGLLLRRGEERDAAEEVRHAEVDEFAPSARDAQRREGHVGRAGHQVADDAVPFHVDVFAGFLVFGLGVDLFRQVVLKSTRKKY